MLTMEKLDLNHALAAKQSGEEDTDFETTEMYWIVGQLPETSRYICCTTNSYALSIWDLYERRCSRIIDTGKVTSFHHDDVIKWKHFPIYWAFVRGIHRSPVNSPHKGQWRRALTSALICARTNGWVDNRDAGDLRRLHAHFDVIVTLN